MQSHPFDILPDLGVEFSLLQDFQFVLYLILPLFLAVGVLQDGDGLLVEDARALHLHLANFDHRVSLVGHREHRRLVLGPRSLLQLKDTSVVVPLALIPQSISKDRRPVQDSLRLHLGGDGLDHLGLEHSALVRLLLSRVLLLLPELD